MTKVQYFCDRCGKEMPSEKDAAHMEVSFGYIFECRRQYKDYYFCDDCAAELKGWLYKLKNKEQET